MTVIKTYTIGPGKDYPTIKSWWDAIRTPESSNLVADNNIIIGQLSLHQHHINEPFYFYSGDVTVDSNRYIILETESNAKFDGIIDILSVQSAEVTGLIQGEYLLKSDVPFFQFKNFYLRSSDLFPVITNTGINNYCMMRIYNSALIDSVGFQKLTFSWPASQPSITGINYNIGIIEAKNNTTVTNCLIHGADISWPSEGSRNSITTTTSICYDDSCQIYNNTLHSSLSSGNQYTTRFESFGIREEFSPLDISGLALWLDIDDNSTLFTNNNLTGRYAASGAEILSVRNKGFYPAHPFGNGGNGPILDYGYFKKRHCLNFDSGTTGDYLIMPRMTGLFDRGYSCFAVLALKDGIPGASQDVLGSVNTVGFTSRPIMWQLPTTNRFYNRVTMNSGTTNNFDSRWNDPNDGPTPFSIYCAILDPSGVIESPPQNMAFQNNISTMKNSLSVNFTTHWKNMQNANTETIGIGGSLSNAASSTSNRGGFYLGELLFYNRPLNSGDMNRITRYLHDKWIYDGNIGSNSVNIASGQVKNNLVGELTTYSPSGLNQSRSFKIVHDNYSNNASVDTWASGYKGTAAITGIDTTAIWTSDTAFLLDIHIKQNSIIRAKAQNLSNIFNTDIDDLPRYNWDIGADEFLFDDTDNCNLFTNGENIVDLNNHINLLTHGFDNFSGLVDLYTLGNLEQSGINNLFIYGSENLTNEVLLNIHGYENLTGHLDLNIYGYQTDNANLELFVKGHLSDSIDGPLYIKGHEELNNNLNLYILGHEENNNNVDFAIIGYENLTGDLPLFLNSHLELDNNTNLFLLAHDESNNNLDLLIHGQDNATGFVELFIQGNEVNSNSVELFLPSIDNASGNLNLVLESRNLTNSGIELNIYGRDILSSSIDFSLVGYEQFASGINLFLPSHEIENNNLNLLTLGKDLYNSGINIQIHGHNISESGVLLNIGGKETQVNNIDLIINGKDIFNSETNLNINGVDINTIALSPPLFIHGHSSLSSSANLVLIGNEETNNLTNLFLASKDQNNNNIELVVTGNEEQNSTLPLYLVGANSANGNTLLNISGVDLTTANNSLDLVLKNELIVLDESFNLLLQVNTPASGFTNLYILGPAVLGFGTNVRNCVREFDIPQELIDTHEQVVSRFINDPDMGVPCNIFYPPKQVQCPNCQYDSIRRTSTNIYKTGGPQPFIGGICPYCNGKGVLNSEESEQIMMNIYWEPRDWINIGLQIESPDGVIQSRGLIADLPKIKRCNYIVPNPRTLNTIRYKYKLEKEPVPHGFRQNKFFVAFWRRINA